VSSFDFGTERLFFGLFPDGTGKFSIYDQNSLTRLALSTMDVTIGQTYTLVAKLDYTAGTVALYVNPNLDLSEGSNTPIATAAFNTSHWSTAVRLASGTGGLVLWDDLAVATTWESLRTYQVTNLNDSGAGSLRVMISLARTNGGRVTFAPELRSMYAVTATNRMLRFKRENPGTLELNVAITGLQPGESLEAIDFRPATGELYGLGRIPTLGDSDIMPQVRLYKLNLATGVAIMTGAGPFSTTLGSYGGMGFDFDPRLDLIRVTNERGDNVLLHPDTGVIPAVQSQLAFSNGATDALGGNVCVLQTAYSNNFPGTSTPTLYGFHNYTRGFIRIGGDGGVPDPANGQVQLLFPITEEIQATSGFDIGDDGAALVSGNALNYNSSDFKSTLYQIDPESGAVTTLGLIGNGITNVTGIAAAPARITLTTVPIAISGGNAFVVDGPSTAPGITLAARGTTTILNATNAPSVAFRHLTFTDGFGIQGGAIEYSAASGPEVNGLLSLDRCTFKGNLANRGGVISIAQGNVRMTHCTLSGNTSRGGGASVIYQQHGGTFGAETWGGILIDHCTIVGNHTSSSTAGNPPQALVIPSAKVTLRNSIIAANTNGGVLPADIRLPSDISQPPVVERSLIGNATGTAVINGTNGNRAGTTASPLLPLLAPLGSYGGPNLTSPPFPGSPAINLAVGSAAASDQRGFLVNGTPDAGAADFRGRSDLLLWWETDWDQDDVSFGLESLLGRNPLAASASAPFEIRPAPSPGASGTHMLYFGATLPPAVGLANGRLRIMRSDNLVAFIQEVGELSPATPGSPTTLIQQTSAPGYTWAGDGSASLRFTPFPDQPRLFFRLEAVLPP